MYCFIAFLGWTLSSRKPLCILPLSLSGRTGTNIRTWTCIMFQTNYGFASATNGKLIRYGPKRRPILPTQSLRSTAPVDEDTKKGNRCCFKTHLPLMPQICVNGQGQHWFRQWRVACSARSHYLNQSWLIVNRNPRNNFSDVLTEIPTFSCKKLYLEMSSAKWRPYYPGRNKLTRLFLQFYEKSSATTEAELEVTS